MPNKWHSQAEGPYRPIRELVCPDIEEPVPSGHVLAERPRYHRYARRLPGTLTAAGVKHPVICRDIGYGGMRVDAPGRVDVKPDQNVSVRVDLNGRVFQDALTVL